MTNLATARSIANRAKHLQQEVTPRQCLACNAIILCVSERRHAALGQVLIIEVVGIDCGHNGVGNPPGQAKESQQHSPRRAAAAVAVAARLRSGAKSKRAGYEAHVGALAAMNKATQSAQTLFLLAMHQCSRHSLCRRLRAAAAAAGTHCAVQSPSGTPATELWPAWAPGRLIKSPHP